MISAKLQLLWKFGHKEAYCHKKVVDIKNGTAKNEAPVAAILNGVEVLLMAQEQQKQSILETHQLCHNQ